MSKSSSFIQGGSQPVEQLGGGVSRQILGFDDQIMMVKVNFEKGAVGAPHHHAHRQTSYVSSGVFEVTIGNKKQVLQAGDGFYAAPDEEHGVVCLEAGSLLDVFTPMRQDFIR